MALSPVDEISLGFEGFVAVRQPVRETDGTAPLMVTK